MSDSPASLPNLSRRRILLGVTGSIAAYKSALLVRLLKKSGAYVQVLMTEGASRFISPLTLGTLSEREVLTEIFPEGPSSEDGGWTKHVDLGLWADLLVVAPATAQTLAKLAHGFCDSMLTATALSARCPMMVCPAMDRDMYTHPSTQRNLTLLREDGHIVMPAAHGELASGLVGQGRMPEPNAIVQRIAHELEDRAFAADRDAHEKAPNETRAVEKPNDSLDGKRVLVTAGPTQEPVDPVRMLTNPSTGTMGFEVAREAARRGADVTLVAGPTSLDTPPGVTRVDVRTTEEMHEAVQSRREEVDLVVMAAAVADYTPKNPSDSKQKKEDGNLVLHLRRTPDILKTLGEHKQPGQTLVGFALETDDGPANARRKIERKNLDWIVLNDPKEEGAGFGTKTNRVTLFHRDGYAEEVPLQSKSQVARILLDRVTASVPEPSGETP
ncbi:bifunctional phosphopantothenoylcysteine decarboxylase/phosphopantothenate--cysteine ligase CoaBC [Longibacter salinarum]|uniref:Coenzyme A biosynthesis bifunctional protein CoaBC n=1 Tax=Longibacter salinarum TaxID=1850348 RepID=A0A2A8CVD5_9BACT|nr:bifunctional phosphopantothenoylcysteine decarboxylase/phosphopantothenate--cysteine ligase CoaBC [Longibacter salinarum]PEN12554.1 bifunctional phosphopantothenoylcysteine decarboxylase/phosphopantothenate--cysteine ligase CoaBC [Longibacter salinarum]